jgi:hypothetical protein
MQNSSQKTQNDVDIADVAYYFEKDVSTFKLQYIIVRYFLLKSGIGIKMMWSGRWRDGKKNSGSQIGNVFVCLSLDDR